MATVWKYVMETPRQTFDMPRYADVLHVGVQAGLIVLWAEVVPDREVESRTFEAVNTGVPLPVTSREHVGSTVSEENGIMWHVYEVMPS